ncbi:hypothetical protein BG006_010347 [Podila minutissima]|uniref:Uncharacterized protein n=1 Tax=Podila minutissima TaxID=64525 RepID=A0A9P5VIP2_9FUNG|nr:hypothetical protein BG006_010347 [Podila minutissima]
MKQLDSRAADEESFRNSEWRSEANEAMIRGAQDFKSPHDTIGSLIEQTPKDYISRFFSRTSCAINAFQDAANITAAFKNYPEQRYDHVKGQYDRSKVNAKIMYGRKKQDLV